MDIKKLYDPKDMALYNFHGQWYTDSDKLNDIAKFRFLDPEEFFERTNRQIRLIKSIPLLRRVLPNTVKIGESMERAKHKERGPTWMVENDMSDWITSFYGFLEKKNKIKSWEEGYKLIKPSKKPTYLDHGYNETKSVDQLDIEDMKKAAIFRGGKCLSTEMTKGDLYTPLQWQCYERHQFMASPYLVLKAGHWCPECEKEAWNFAEIAKHSPFFAQVWVPLHDYEDAVYVKKIVNEDVI